MKPTVKYIAALILTMGSISSEAMTVWVVETGHDPFSNSQGELALSAGTTALNLYYDVGAEISYGYDFTLDIIGSGSITNVGGGDSGLGNTFGSGWRQLGGDISGETGSSVLAFSFDFTADPGSSLVISGSYTDSNFIDAPIPLTTLASVPVPAAVWLFGSGLMGLVGFSRRKKS